jgi:hypothetical protein
MGWPRRYAGGDGLSDTTPKHGVGTNHIGLEDFADLIAALHRGQAEIWEMMHA